MLRQYSIMLRDPLGAFLGYIENEFTTQWVLNINKAGRLIMDVPGEFCTSQGTYGIGDFGEDFRIEVWRYVDGVQTLVSEGPFLIDHLSSRLDSTGMRSIHIEAETSNGILWRRRNTNDAQTNEADLNPLPCDDQMKYVWDKNYTNDADSYQFLIPDDPIRDLSAFAVREANATAIAAQYEAKIPHQNIGDVMRKIADYALSQGEPLFFDVVQINQTGNPFLEFRTYIGQRGQDRTAGNAAVTVSAENGTIGEYALSYDWQKTSNRVYAGGEGKGNARQFAIAAVPTLAADLAARPLSLREHFHNANADDLVELQTEAEQVLEAKRPHIQLSGVLAETTTFMYGREWTFGDRLRAHVEGLLLDVWVVSEQVELSEGRETVTGTFSTDYDLDLTGLGEYAQAIADNRRNLDFLGTIERN